jgi:hypothetical protein
MEMTGHDHQRSGAEPANAPGAAPGSAFGQQNAYGFGFPPPSDRRRPTPWWHGGVGVVGIVTMAVVAIVASIGVFGILERTAGGWREVFVENFDVPVALGDFPGPEYADRWMSYDGFEDTSGIGLYKPSEVLSVHDGSLDMYLHTKAGRPLGAAPVPLINGEWRGHLYGRYTVRFKTDALEGFGAGWLLWPDSNDWNEGEIDFPEGGLDATIQANQHCIGDPEEKCLAVDTGVEFSDGWHTTMIEWTPSGVVYYLDGRVVGTSPESPSTPMHLVLQTGTNGVKPHASVAGHVLIDSVTISAWG